MNPCKGSHCQLASPKILQVSLPIPDPTRSKHRRRAQKISNRKTPMTAVHHPHATPNQYSLRYSQDLPFSPVRQYGPGPQTYHPIIRAYIPYTTLAKTRLSLYTENRTRRKIKDVLYMGREGDVDRLHPFPPFSTYASDTPISLSKENQKESFKPLEYRRRLFRSLCGRRAISYNNIRYESLKVRPCVTCVRICGWFFVFVICLVGEKI